MKIIRSNKNQPTSPLLLEERGLFCPLLLQYCLFVALMEEWTLRSVEQKREPRNSCPQIRPTSLGQTCKSKSMKTGFSTNDAGAVGHL